MHACVRGSAAECGEVRAAAEGREGGMDGRMDECTRVRYSLLSPLLPD